MRGVLVALDLETTGLDMTNAQIIEIGAVKFRDHDILETYTTLVDPGSPIPPKITAITGITQENMLGAPKLPDVLSRVRQFVGDAPLVGHNIDFDLNFLQKQGIAQNNVSIDTYELASVLLPTTPRYNLNALMQELNLQPDGSYHRALADAQATARVYMALWDKLMNDVPLDLLQEIVVASRALPWKGSPAFADALAARTGDSTVVPDVLGALKGFKVAVSGKPPLKAADHPKRLDMAVVTAVLSDQVANTIDSFENRISQVEMLEAVTQAFNDQEGLIVEAAAGTGRSFAYLIPAILWSVRNNERVVISVNTESLQNQLLQHDIPLLQKALGVDVEAVLIKNRSAYLCPQRLEALRRRQPTSVEELRVLAKVQMHLNESDDTNPISLRGPAEYSTWTRLSAQDEDCTVYRCETRMNGICPFYQAQKAAECAHLIVVNHSVLIADAFTMPPERRVVPEYNAVIVDEAHNLEEAVTNSLSFRLEAAAIKRQIADLGTSKTGLLGEVLSSTRATVPENYFETIKGYVAVIADAGKKMQHHVDGLFKALQDFLEATNNLKSSDYMMQVRLSRELRNNPAFSQVKAVWAILSQFTAGIADAMTKMSGALTKLQTRHPISDDVLDSVDAAAEHLHNIHEQLNALTTEPLENTVYWMEINQSMEVYSVRGAPLQIGPLIQRALWDNKKTVIMTSATLRTNASFGYIRRQFNAENVRELALTSPFDYTKSTLIFLPTDMPEPQERNKYQHAVERGLIELATATQGRMLALFTGYTQLRQVAQNIAPRLALGNISVFDQSDGTSRQALLDNFRSAEKGVLLGTRSFWEDVDLFGDDLVALAIVRLPFAVPTDAVYAARAETYDNSFDQYTIPEAILRFRQGFDRLIRARTDKGIVAVFDKRMTSKSYGQLFLDSLPDCTVRQGPLADLAAAAKEWLNDPLSR